MSFREGQGSANLCLVLRTQDPGDACPLSGILVSSSPIRVRWELVGDLPDRSCGPSHQTTALSTSTEPHTPRLIFWPHLTGFHIEGSVENYT